MSAVRDNPGVIAPPPLLFGGFFFVGLLLDRPWLADGNSTGVPFLPRALAAAALAATAGALAGGAVRLMRRAGTNVLPSEPSTALVTGGVYRISRNPIYLGLALLYVALSLCADAPLTLTLLVPLLLVMDRLVVVREERYLGAKFGTAFADYRAKVRRWL